MNVKEEVLIPQEFSMKKKSDHVSAILSEEEIRSSDRQSQYKEFGKNKRP